MSKPKLRKIAKNMKDQPKLKKLLAEWLAERSLEKGEYDTYEMLYKGNRGFLAMSEKELTDKFDKQYSEFEEQIKELKKDKEKLDMWQHRYYNEKIQSIELKIKEADKVYDYIFEEVFL